MRLPAEVSRLLLRVSFLLPIALAAAILESLPADATFDVDDQEWMAEIRSRRDEVLNGQTVMRDWSDVRAEMLTELASPRSA